MVSKPKVSLFLKIVGLKSPLSSSSSPVEFRDLGHNLQGCEDDVLQALRWTQTYPIVHSICVSFTSVTNMASPILNRWFLHVKCLLTALTSKRNLFLLMLRIFLETAPNGSLTKSLECWWPGKLFCWNLRSFSNVLSGKNY